MSFTTIANQLTQKKSFSIPTVKRATQRSSKLSLSTDRSATVAMILKPFEYSAPTKLEEACQIIKDHEGAKVLAGGQSLLPIMKLNLAEVSFIVDLKKIPNLSFIKVESVANEDFLVVGALTTHREVAQSDLVKRTIPLLAESANGIGHPLVRNRGTIGGSLAHCDPAADVCVSSLALNAKMTLAKYDGTKRTLPAQDFFQGTFTTALEPGEILEKISFPLPPRGTGYAFEKLTMGHGDFPLIVVSVLLKMKGKKCEDAVIALGGVSDRPVRMNQAENMLRSKEEVSANDLDQVGVAASEASHPESDLDVSAEYKKKMVRVLVRRALTRAVETRSAV